MRGVSVLVFAAAAVSTTIMAAQALPAADPAPERALLNRYCVSCHNDRLKTQGLTLQTIDTANVPRSAETWEKVIRKLRTGAMPPPGLPRPDEAGYATLVSWLESEIDRDAAAHPNPGRTETIHRLNRAEYHRAIRDLLALDIDVAELLPADDMSYGFDNIAGVLKVTPSLLDRYMAAARRISRVAIGDPTLPPTANTFRLRADLSQDESFEELPLGTRGGTAIRHHFPVDATYSIKVEPLGGGADPHQLEVSVDGVRVQLFMLNPRAGMGTGQGYDSEGDAYEVKVPVTAGPHVVAVTFVKKTSALVEGIREPFLAPHAEGAPRTEPAVGSVTITGPFDSKGASTTPSRERIFVCRPAAAGNEERCTRQILSTLARRAYRRAPTDAELAVLTTFAAEGRAKSGFEGGIEMALRRLLVSPEFLFRVETDPPGVAPDTAYAIGDLELASRLSFFLWSSIPDDALLDAALKGTLRKPAVLEQQVRRMLADSRAEALAKNFAGQWLQLRTLEGSSPNEFLFPNFGENLRRDFRRETELLVGSILSENRSVLDFLTADYTFVNERLARHYDIPNVYGGHFRRVALADPNRRGLLGQGSFLTVTSLADRTTVVGRGKWILDNVLGAPPPPPPPNVPPLKENQNGGKVLSLRERMQQHRDNPVCASCHSRMDPLGFALENFDATGQWRTHEGDTRIDASAVLPDGTKFEGPAGLRTWLLRHPEQFATALTEKLLVYALGRGLEYYDAPAVRRIVRDAATDNYRFQSLLAGVAKSVPFQMRKSTPAVETTGSASGAERGGAPRAKRADRGRDPGVKIEE
jgi:mono/diheme cytochrome c family protein